jgi:nitroreductase
MLTGNMMMMIMMHGLGGFWVGGSDPMHMGLGMAKPHTTSTPTKMEGDQ